MVAISNTRMHSQSAIFRRIVAITPMITFALIVASLLAVTPEPNVALGYFSFEFLAPWTYWVLLLALGASTVFLIQMNHRLAFFGIVLTMLAMRLPLLLMFKLPNGPDSYTYMNIIQQWNAAGRIDLTIDSRAQFWPVSFLLLYALTKLGLGEINLWLAALPVLYFTNLLLASILLKRLTSKKIAEYATLLVCVAPTFNFYFYEIVAPQLFGATLFLLGLIIIFEYEKRRVVSRILAFIAVFVVLLFTHHLTSLLLAAYVFMLAVGEMLAKHLKKRLATPKGPIAGFKHLLPLSFGMILAWFIYFFGVSQVISHRFLGVLISVLQGNPSSYPLGEGPGPYFIGTYAFSVNSLSVYNYRLIPLGIAGLLVLAVWFVQTKKIVLSHRFDRANLRIFASTGFFAFLMIVSFTLLNGLFLEIPRLFDVVVLFASVPIAGWFVNSQKVKSINSAKVLSLVLIVMVASTLGMGVHSSEFVYYTQERDAILFVTKLYPHAVLYTDERLVAFAGYFAPTFVVREIPLTLTDMLPNRTSPTVLVLISYHSLAYNSYRPVYIDAPSEILHFVETGGTVVYSNQGIEVYTLH
ncbi:MAG: hypothetical protein WB661_13025 [Candidatus Bathyarchaeia archaeon]